MPTRTWCYMNRWESKRTGCGHGMGHLWGYRLFDEGIIKSWIYIPGTSLSTILGVEPSKTRPFSSKTRVIWVVADWFIVLSACGNCWSRFLISLRCITISFCRVLGAVCIHLGYVNHHNRHVLVLGANHLVFPILCTFPVIKVLYLNVASLPL